jgi:parallel beta-helix repeat protein
MRICRRLVMIGKTGVAVLMAGLCILSSSACSTPTPPPLARREVAPNAVIDPARPCIRETPAAAPTNRPAPPDLDVTFERATNKIVLTAGKGVTLPALSGALGAPAALREVAPGEWLLGATIEILPGASLQVSVPDVRWLMLSSSPAGFASVKALGGGLDITGTCVTSWDPTQGRADTDHLDGRSFLLARNGGQLTIDHAEVRYLGYGEVEAYGMSWRVQGTSGHITNSIVSHLFYGLYTFDISGLVVQDNEFHDNVLYGIDPHTNSHRLLIERNIVHDNGKHGIILAEDCTDSVIRDNIVYRNAHHGIVLYLNSDRNIVEGNESFANAASGININQSAGNTVRGNRSYDNAESGIGVSQTAQDNILENNQIRGNRQDGVRLVSEATHTTLRNNIIGENALYGVYIDSTNPYALTGNTIFNNRTGIMLENAAPPPPTDNRVFGNDKADIARATR